MSGDKTTMREVLDLFERFEDQSNNRLDRFQKQYDKLTDNMSTMAISISELATSVKISEDRRRHDHKRMDDIEKRQSQQGIELGKTITKVDKNTWIQASAVRGFLILLTAFAGGVVTMVSGYVLLKARGLI